MYTPTDAEIQEITQLINDLAVMPRVERLVVVPVGVDNVFRHRPYASLSVAIRLRSERTMRFVLPLSDYASFETLRQDACDYMMAAIAEEDLCTEESPRRIDINDAKYRYKTRPE